MFGGGDGIAERRIHHDDSLRGRGWNIDIVNTYPSAADHFQPRGAVEQFGGDFGRRANRKAIELTDDTRELLLILAEARLKIGVNSALLEDGNCGWRQGIRNQHTRSHGAVSLLCL